MHFEAELHLLTEAFRRAGNPVLIADPDSPICRYINTIFPYLSLHDEAVAQRPLRTFLPETKPATVYSLADPFLLRYTYFLLPDVQPDAVMIIGPYLDRELTDEEILERIATFPITPEQQMYFRRFYASLPVFSRERSLYSLLEVFFERIWGAGNFAYQSFRREHYFNLGEFQKSLTENENFGTQWNMEIVEKRYASENALMDAVRTANLQKVESHMAKITAAAFEKRLPDHMRTLKNYCIITNTLLRKAAEQGGVHPVYLDSVSSAFALKIEQLASPAACHEIIGTIARAYCRLVKSHAAKGCSPAVQKAMVYIDADLSAPLSLASLAEKLNINSSYLSALFKKETGLTITSYIIRQRIHYAKYLLENTRLQIQLVAQQCGLADVHYFSKVFKKETGMTPRQFRQSIK